MNWKRLRSGLCIAWLIPLAPVEAEPTLEQTELVIMSADSAWEEPGVRGIYFDGNFKLQGSDWAMEAGSAFVSGALEDPDSIVAHGNPARITFETGIAGSHQRVEGEAESVEYIRQTEMLYLSKSARVLSGTDVMYGGKIQYDRNADRFTASGNSGPDGAGRVRFELNK